MRAKMTTTIAMISAARYGLFSFHLSSTEYVLFGGFSILRLRFTILNLGIHFHCWEVLYITAPLGFPVKFIPLKHLRAHRGELLPCTPQLIRVSNFIHFVYPLSLEKSLVYLFRLDQMCQAFKSNLFILMILNVV